jgi:hypothetical protein
MTTHQLHLNPVRKTDTANGIAVLFFLLGVPSIYSALQQRSLIRTQATRNPTWALGAGILAFVMVGTWTCITAMG